MNPDEYCQRKATASGSSFYYSFLFLPVERRRAITALYAYCREVDDAVDEPTDPSVARSRLAWWRDEVARLFEGMPQHPVTRALAPHLRVYGLERSAMDQILDGMEMDLHQARYQSFDALRLYCHRVAGVVGELAARIFGHSNARTLDYAARLGLAFQLTNIIRDVGEDARRGRIYVPIDDLAKFQVPANDILQTRSSPAFVALMEFRTARAEQCYDDAMALLPAEDRRRQRPGLVMAAIYRTLLIEIRADGFKVLNQRTSLTPVRKLWIAWKTWIRT